MSQLSFAIDLQFEKCREEKKETAGVGEDF